MPEVKDIISPEAAKAAAEVKKPVEPAKVAEPAKVPEGEKVGDLLKKPEKEKPTIRESEFLELKSQNERVWTEMKKLQELVGEGVSKKEVSEKLKQIGEKYKVDPEFLGEVSAAIKAEADVETDKKVSAKLKPLEEERTAGKAENESQRIDRIFQENYAKTLEQLPDFKDIADPEYVKYLTLRSENADKTFAQILEKAYGNQVKGKGKTFDNPQPGGRNENTVIDFDKASKDSEYFRTLMADPATRSEYNKGLAKRLKL